MSTAVLVGANGAIGSAIAERLADAGHRLVLVARDPERLDALAAGLHDGGADVVTAARDAAEPGALAEVLADEAPAGIEVAVNNLGAAHRPTPFAELALDELDRVLSVSLRGVALCLQAELAVIGDGGSIVTVTSSAGVAAAPGMGGYAAAKAGLIGLTRVIAVDYGARGIRCNAVAPGPILSGGVLTQPEEVRAGIGRHLPLQRMGEAGEVADVVAWLASSASSFVTGAVVGVDGGKTA